MPIKKYPSDREGTELRWSLTGGLSEGGQSIEQSKGLTERDNQ